MLCVWARVQAAKDPQMVVLSYSSGRTIHHAERQQRGLKHEHRCILLIIKGHTVAQASICFVSHTFTLSHRRTSIHNHFNSSATIVQGSGFRSHHFIVKTACLILQHSISAAKNGKTLHIWLTTSTTRTGAGPLCTNNKKIIIIFMGGDGGETIWMFIIL